MELQYAPIGSHDNKMIVAMSYDMFSAFQMWAVNPYPEKIREQKDSLTIMSAEQFAQETSVTPSTVREWCKTILRDAASNRGKMWFIDEEKAKRILVSKDECQKNDLEFAPIRTNTDLDKTRKERPRYTRRRTAQSA